MSGTRVSNGIACPTCGEYDWKVTDSRPSAGYVHRRRECRICGTRISTREEPVEARVAPEPDSIGAGVVDGLVDRIERLGT